jgi:predicted transcriptional regulator
MIIESTLTIDRSHFAELARVVAIFVENTVVPHIATPHTINETNTEMSMLFLQRLVLSGKNLPFMTYVRIGFSIVMA